MGHKTRGVPADADEEAVEPHYAVPGVEATVYTENLQVGEGSVAAKDYTTASSGTAHRVPRVCSPHMRAPACLASLVEPARISLS